MPSLHMTAVPSARVADVIAIQANVDFQSFLADNQGRDYLSAAASFAPNGRIFCEVALFP